MPGVLRQLADMGCAPGTVIDVGAADGTRPLYEAFPDARHVLIEPLVEFEETLRALCDEWSAEYVLAVAGATSGSATINVHADLEGSSLLCETETFEINGQPRDVPAVTLDELVSERNLPTPYLIKVDVQGGELEVLEGAQATLPHTDAVILETTLFGTFDGGPQFIDVLSYMARREFVVYDLFGQLYRPLDGALIQTDVVFVREQSEYRKHHHYATPEQRREQLGG